MIKGNYDELMEIARWNVCAEHLTPLEVAWYSPDKIYALRCEHDHFPDKLMRNMSLTEGYRVGEELPSPLKENVEEGMRKREAKVPGAGTAVTFSGVPAADLGTGELLAPEVVQGLVNYAHKYGLDPARGHVVLMYGKPYLTLDGYLYHAKGSGRLYSIESRPLDKAECEIYQVPEGAHAWISTVRFAGPGNYLTGLGIVTQEEMTEISKGKPGQLRSPVVAAHPWQMAQKRAEWQALRRAFPIGESEEGKEE